jgi:hypothetical protein
MSFEAEQHAVNSNPVVNTQSAACPGELENAKHRELVASNGVTTIKSSTLQSTQCATPITHNGDMLCTHYHSIIPGSPAGTLITR